MLTQTLSWIHFAQLESYIKERLLEGTCNSCLCKNKRCLQFDVSLDGTKHKSKLKVYFDMVVDNNLILLEPINDWMNSLSYCQIEQIEFLYPDKLNSCFQDYIELEMVLYPCKRRAF